MNPLASDVPGSPLSASLQLRQPAGSEAAEAASAHAEEEGGESDYTVYSDDDSSDEYLYPLSSHSKDSISTVIDCFKDVKSDHGNADSKDSSGEGQSMLAASLADLLDTPGTSLPLTSQQHRSSKSAVLPAAAPPRPPPPSKPGGRDDSEASSLQEVAVTAAQPPGKARTASKTGSPASKNSGNTVSPTSRNVRARALSATTRSRAMQAQRQKLAWVERRRQGAANDDKKTAAERAAKTTSQPARTRKALREAARGGSKPISRMLKKSSSGYARRQALLDCDATNDNAILPTTDPAVCCRKDNPARVPAQTPGRRVIYLQSTARPRSKKPSSVLTLRDYASSNNSESDETDDERLELDLPAEKLQVQAKLPGFALKIDASKLFLPNQNKKAVIAAAFEDYKQQSHLLHRTGNLVKSFSTEFVSCPTAASAILMRDACDSATKTHKEMSDEDFDINCGVPLEVCPLRDAGSDAFCLSSTEDSLPMFAGCDQLDLPDDQDVRSEDSGEGCSRSSTESSESEEPEEEKKPVSAQWHHFQQIASRITDSVQRTQASLKKLATESSSGVRGGATAATPHSPDKAWQSSAADSNKTAFGSYTAMEFDDDYDPSKKADVIGLAFGERPFGQAKAKSSVCSEPAAAGSSFEDHYDPGVDNSDSLAAAFGDGFRTKRAARPAGGQGFESSFSSSCDKAVRPPDEVVAAVAPAAERPKASAKIPPSRPKAPPAFVKAAQNPKGSQVCAASANGLSHTAPAASLLEPSGCVAAEPVLIDDLLGLTCAQGSSGELIKADCTEVTGMVSKLGASDCSNTSTSHTAAPPTAQHQETHSQAATACGQRPSGDEPVRISPRPMVQINIIEASLEEACADDVLGEDSSTSEEITSTGDVPSASEDESSFEIVDSHARSAAEGPVALDEFDAIVHRLSVSFGMDSENDALDILQSGSVCTAWAESVPIDVNGGEFKADFSSIGASDAKSEFSCMSPFDGIFDSSPVSKQCDHGKDAAEPKLRDSVDDPFCPSAMKTSTKDLINDPVTNDEASVKRVFRFARTFSETVNEEDDVDPELVGLARSNNAKQDMPLSKPDSAASAAASQLSFVVDMTKPSPAIKRLGTDTKRAANSLNIKSQAARAGRGRASAASSQVNVKSIPRPKAQRQVAGPHEAGSARSPCQLPTQSGPGRAVATDAVALACGKKIATQGEADLLSLQEQQKVVTLNFEIDTAGSGACTSQGGSGGVSLTVPLLPPPPVHPVEPSRANPFAAADGSSGSDEDGPLVVLDGGARPTAAPVPMSPLVSTSLQGCMSAGAASRSAPPDEMDSPVAAVAVVAMAAVIDEEHVKAAPLPLEDFRPKYTGHGWTLLLRKPPKKSLTKKRFWEEVYVRLVSEDKTTKLLFYRSERAALKGEPALHELKLCAAHQLVPCGGVLALQQHDQYGKCHSVKLVHVHYRERPGGGMRAADRVAEVLPGFLKGYVRRAASLQPVATSGGSGAAHVLLEHVPHTTELAKFGATDGVGMRAFVSELEDSLMHLPGAERIGVNITYEKEEIIADAWDEYEALVDSKGHIVRQKARVRLFVVTFVSGMPTLELGINDRRRKGKEVVGRHDIVPVRAENWVNVESEELHQLVKKKDYDETGSIRFQPLDACKFELMRFRYRPKANYELPLQLDAKMAVDKEKRLLEIRADVMIPGYYSNSKRKGQVPCEDIQITFPIPDEWIYKFRVEKHFKYGSLHAAARKPGKIKGIERLTTAMGTVVGQYMSSSFIECSVGDAKYEHVFHAVVWRIGCLPLRNQGAYKMHYFALRLELAPHDAIPDAFQLNAGVEFTMPHTTVSGTAIRSISNCSSPEPLEKWVYHHARFCYTVEMSFEREIKDLLPKDEAELAEVKAEEPSGEMLAGDDSGSSSDEATEPGSAPEHSPSSSSSPERRHEKEKSDDRQSAEAAPCQLLDL